MPEIKVKRFSRSKELIVDNQFEDAPDELLEKPILKRGRKAKEPIKSVVNESVLNNDNIINNVNVINEDLHEPFYDNNDDNFLKELNDKQEEEIEKAEKPQKPQKSSEMEHMMQSMFKSNKKKVNKDDDDNDSIYSNVGTVIKGRDTLLLTSKVKQFKLLFPEELKAFKIKKNATTQELTAYLSEMSLIVEIETLEEFITDSILQSLTLIEGVSFFTRYNISGLSAALQSNPQFNKLCKQLYIKYNVFSSIPPEFQMLFLVSTTAFVCKIKNDKKFEMNKFLNEPFVNNERNINYFYFLNYKYKLSITFIYINSMWPRLSNNIKPINLGKITNSIQIHHKPDMAPINKIFHNSNQEIKTGLKQAGATINKGLAETGDVIKDGIGVAGNALKGLSNELMLPLLLGGAVVLIIVMNK